MTVHLFGATSSPGCANFALKSTANDFEEEFGASAADFARKDFYIDYGLKSVPLVDETVKLVVSVKRSKISVAKEASNFTSLCPTVKKSSEESQSKTEQMM